MTLIAQIFCRCKSSALLGISLAAVSLAMAGCAASPKSSRMATTEVDPLRVVKGPADEADIEKRLRREYGRWQGTQHHLGGNGRRGIDCSGFVKAVYKDVFGLDLPRTTRTQVRLGRAVSFEKLRAGDLVFFRPPSYPRHVGIYLGGDEFVHASKNKGVTVSKIDPYYWGKYYWTARRILPASRHP